ncbi:MAG: tetratricopeptide repeat protein [Kiritimatiellae bacterium]|nr:tetratricopeptide repeat protein [Kiritimatiellia bacterium]
MFYGRLIGFHRRVNLLFFVGMVSGCFYPAGSSLFAQWVDGPAAGPAWTLDEVTRERAILRDRSPQEVIAQCTTLIEDNTFSTVGLAQMYHERGVARFAPEEYDDALSDFDQALLLNPSFSYALVEKARVFVARGEFNRAAFALDEAGPLKTDPLVMGSRALISIQLARYEEALALLNEALRSNPEEARLYIIRAMVYYAQKQTRAGDNDMADARRLNPKWVSVYHQAQEEVEQVRPTEATDEGTVLPMDSGEALVSITHLYEKGAYAEVCRMADEMLDREPDLLRIRLYRARSLLALGKQAAAIPDLSRLIDKVGPREDLYLLRAHAYYASNGYAEALEDYRHALDIHPQSDEALRGIQRVQEETGLP